MAQDQSFCNPLVRARPLYKVTPFVQAAPSPKHYPFNAPGNLRARRLTGLESSQAAQCVPSAIDEHRQLVAKRRCSGVDRQQLAVQRLPLPSSPTGEGGKGGQASWQTPPQFEGGVVWVPVTPTDVGEIWLCVKASGGLRSTGDGINDGGGGQLTVVAGELMPIGWQPPASAVLRSGRTAVWHFVSSGIKGSLPPRGLPPNTV
eukprot:CAMPEP_0174303598 /NCGR_PEP_ID=MMETSP0809-20121228/60281_1 /TAXON_ID=73025 ORGANISM="Eutreptiella gymnastica-like, Strain CCMP1594" /NCGR_SAMPLE_ID=MMETSP0809 /ASSEMBLY_ACC=CAM_ASM_000658 /LENGTH=202 /DNA_ID=CAMNT_0015409653 /DNA_START=769 /DNA_END=1375 /DNA_ORIENTATION=+